MTNDDIILRLREDARVCRQILITKSVQEGKQDKLADLLDEAADTIEKYKEHSVQLNLGCWKLAEVLGYVKYDDTEIRVSAEDLFQESVDTIKELRKDYIHLKEIYQDTLWGER